MPDLISEVREKAQRHMVSGETVPLIPRVSLFASSAATCSIQALYEPMFCLVLNGSKEVLIGDHQLRYEMGTCFVGSVELPVSSRILEATPENPYIALTLKLDLEKIAALATEFPSAIDEAYLGTSFGVNPASPELIEPCLRLLRLLDSPEDIPALAPMIEREILYRLLKGPQQAILRQMVGSDSRLSQVRRAINCIRDNFDRSLPVKQLADHASMSQASLHRHFKAVTGMTPLQYQKRLRLQEARLRLVGGADVSKAAYGVGYESPSQFSREYTRLFGQPPSVDAQALRGQGERLQRISEAPF